ncbi:hypothetical protein K8B33_15910 [Alcanivorax sp. JB21]|uniref:hypothetical protein n=1 Tax=Alcanivorax limicola TaxID=2874102 RepID=UPI001CBA9497|nr:hypothetical protein [Alcanivorax limicola]MBZ2188662.1 hypothetical protein [Alcanivorax limicola]MBZ2190592.1 hypothetical protein [Alcanivorax limicola]
MVTTGLTKEDSETIGFVVASLFSSAIDTGELREWAVLTVGEMDVSEMPGYLLDLMEFDGPLSSVYRIVGFDPVWNRSDDEDLALTGLAIKRNKKIYDMPASPDAIQQSLSENHEVEEMFRRIFPFINF